jgi:hypothetical protein
MIILKWDVTATEPGGWMKLRWLVNTKSSGEPLAIFQNSLICWSGIDWIEAILGLNNLTKKEVPQN